MTRLQELYDELRKIDGLILNLRDGELEVKLDEHRVSDTERSLLEKLHKLSGATFLPYRRHAMVFKGGVFRISMGRIIARALITWEGVAEEDHYVKEQKHPLGEDVTENMDSPLCRLKDSIRQNSSALITIDTIFKGEELDMIVIHRKGMLANGLANRIIENVEGIAVISERDYDSNGYFEPFRIHFDGDIFSVAENKDSSRHVSITWVGGAEELAVSKVESSPTVAFRDALNDDDFPAATIMKPFMGDNHDWQMFIVARGKRETAGTILQRVLDTSGIERLHNTITFNLPVQVTYGGNIFELTPTIYKESTALLVSFVKAVSIPVLAEEELYADLTENPSRLLKNHFSINRVGNIGIPSGNFLLMSPLSSEETYVEMAHRLLEIEGIKPRYGDILRGQPFDIMFQGYVYEVNPDKIGKRNVLSISYKVRPESAANAPDGLQWFDGEKVHTVRTKPKSEAIDAVLSVRESAAEERSNGLQRPLIATESPEDDEDNLDPADWSEEEPHGITTLQNTNQSSEEVKPMKLTKKQRRMEKLIALIIQKSDFEVSRSERDNVLDKSRKLIHRVHDDDGQPSQFNTYETICLSAQIDREVYDLANGTGEFVFRDRRYSFNLEDNSDGTVRIYLAQKGKRLTQNKEERKRQRMDMLIENICIHVSVFKARSDDSSQALRRLVYKGGMNPAVTNPVVTNPVVTGRNVVSAFGVTEKVRHVQYDEESNTGTFRFKKHVFVFSLEESTEDSIVMITICEDEKHQKRKKSPLSRIGRLSQALLKSDEISEVESKLEDLESCRTFKIPIPTNDGQSRKHQHVLFEMTNAEVQVATYDSMYGKGFLIFEGHYYSYRICPNESSDSFILAVLENLADSEKGEALHSEKKEEPKGEVDEVSVRIDSLLSVMESEGDFIRMKRRGHDFKYSRRISFGLPNGSNRMPTYRETLSGMLSSNKLIHLSFDPEKAKGVFVFDERQFEYSMESSNSLNRIIITVNEILGKPSVMVLERTDDILPTAQTIEPECWPVVKTPKKKGKKSPLDKLLKFLLKNTDEDVIGKVKKGKGKTKYIKMTYNFPKSDNVTDANSIMADILSNEGIDNRETCGNEQCANYFTHRGVQFYCVVMEPHNGKAEVLITMTQKASKKKKKKKKKSKYVTVLRPKLLVKKRPLNNLQQAIIRGRTFTVSGDLKRLKATGEIIVRFKPMMGEDCTPQQALSYLSRTPGVYMNGVFGHHGVFFYSAREYAVTFWARKGKVYGRIIMISAK